MTPDLRPTLVLPTIRQESAEAFFEAWGDGFDGCRAIVVEDNPARSFKLPEWAEHYSWEEIDDQLGDESWIIPRRTDCVRSFGYLKAIERPTEFIWTLDDDCYPESGRAAGSYVPAMRAALERRWPSDQWWNTLESDELYPRGYPYDIRSEEVAPTAIHHGLWSEVPDLDAITQLKMPGLRLPPVDGVSRVPSGRFFPMCGMHLAWRPEVTPAVYFLLMGRDYAYDRFGDIWAGILCKRICDHLGYAVSSGGPSIAHKRASNVQANLKKEAPGMEVNEVLWREVGNVRLTSQTFAGAYAELAERLAMDGPYWNRVREAMTVWVRLTETSLASWATAEAR